MKKTARALGCLLLAAALFFLTPQAFFMKAEALEPSVSVGAVYKRSAYYRRLTAVELTGDQRYDTLSVALSQIGYHEGDSELDMDGMNLDGGKNFVEFTRVYGKVDNKEGNGVSYGYEWCAAFVSWCLRQAGVKTSAAVTEISCGRMTNWYKSNGAFFERETYDPTAGDVIMFQRDGKPSHVGLVLGTRDGTVYTVEGNNGGRVAIHSYDGDDDYIYGYCVPDYTRVDGVDCAALLDENVNVAGRYIVTGGSLNARSAPTTDSEIVNVLKRGDGVTVTEFEGEWGKIDLDGTECWISTSLAVQEKYMVYSVKYEANGGKDGVQYQRKLYGDALNISSKTPTRGGYEFLGWDTESKAENVVYKVGDEYSANEDLTLYAVWKPIVYTVTFYNDDGSIISQKECAFQDWVEEPATPEKASDGEYSYTFAGWDSELADVVVKDLSYTATYTAVPLPPAANDDVDRRIAIVISVTAVSIAAAAAAVTLFVLNKQKKSAAV